MNMKRIYLSDLPDIVSEWDYEKNKDLNPTKIVASSKKKVWWKCKNGHSWLAMISNRARLGRSCPYCSHQLPIIGETDLFSLYPNIYHEMEKSSKNKDIDLRTIMPGTHKEAWFICANCGYEYKKRIYSRTKGSGCPVCASKIIIKGINDFGTKRPELIREWNFEKNDNVSPYAIPINYNKEVWWICPIGHEYKAKVSQRSYGKQCPICISSNKTSFPEQAILYYVKKLFHNTVNRYKSVFDNSMELDIYIPDLKIGIEYDGIHWHNGEESLNRELKKYRICKENDIYLIRVREEKYPENVETCDLLFVLDETKNDGKLDSIIISILSTLASISTKYGVFNNEMSMADRVKLSIDLYDVNVKRDRRKIQSYLNEFDGSLAQFRPDLVEEWDFKKNEPLTPYNVKLNSNEKVWWKCQKCGNEWITSISERGGHDSTNCPKCSKEIGGKKHHDFVLRQKGSLFQTHPHLLSKWDYERNILSPKDVVAGSGEKVWWKCQKCGYSWKTSVCHMTARDSNCPVCLNRVCLTGYNDLKTKYPNLIEDWDYDKNLEDPSMITSSGKRAFWKCHTCGYEWSALIISRIRGTGCPQCAINRRKKN